MEAPGGYLKSIQSLEQRHHQNDVNDGINISSIFLFDSLQSEPKLDPALISVERLYLQKQIHVQSKL